MARYSNNGPPSFLIFLVIAIACLIWLIAVSVSSVQYATGSAWTVGRVSACYAHGSSPRGSKSYNPDPGQKCEYDFMVGKDSYWGTSEERNLQEGQKVRVAYLTANPSNNSLERPHWYPMGLVALVGFVVSFGVCLKLFMSNDDLQDD